MSLLAIIAAAEAMLFTASGAKRNQARRQQVLMGNNLNTCPACRYVPQAEDCGSKQSPGIRRLQAGGNLSPGCSHTVVRLPAPARNSNGHP